MPWNASVQLPQLARHDGANEHKQRHLDTQVGRGLAILEYKMVSSASAASTRNTGERL
jgi:hypothetical protein